MAHLKDVDREELLRQVESLHKKFAEGLNCSERVFLTIHSLLKTDIPSEAVALLSGFGGGVAGIRDGMCGAISGGVAAIGLVYGRRKPPEGSRERMYEVPRDFVCRFKTRYWDNNMSRAHRRPVTRRNGRIRGEEEAEMFPVYSECCQDVHRSPVQIRENACRVGWGKATSFKDEGYLPFKLKYDITHIHRDIERGTAESWSEGYFSFAASQP